MANTSKRGFASMDAAKQREIASKGGKAAHAKGTAHEFTSDEARVAGRKGGEAVSRDRAHMSAIGREGGHSRGARARANSSEPESTRPQSFNRPVNEDRSAFGESRAAAAGSFGAQERGSSERGYSGSSSSRSGSNQNSGSSKNERGVDTPSSSNPFSGRDEN